MPAHLRHRPLPPRAVYLRHLRRNSLIASGLIAGSLFVGMLGYHELEGMNWMDAFLNASMILGGMGPVSQIQTTGGKLFAGCYAIFSGVVFITMSAVVLAPVLQRFLHRFHLAISPQEEPQQERKQA
jgi:hypothetical protein